MANYCPYGFSIRKGSLATILRGVRGKSRKTVEIAITRALTLIQDEIEVASIKDKRGPKADKLLSAYIKAERTARERLDAALIKLYPDLPKTSITNGSPAYNSGARMKALLLNHYVLKLRSNVENLAFDIAKKYRAEAEAESSTNPCGISTPTAKDLKTVAKDPALKAALDAFTSALEVK